MLGFPLDPVVTSTKSVILATKVKTRRGGADMKFVVYGADRRVGLLHNSHVCDVTAMTAKYLHEREDERQPLAMAAALTPSDLEAFIEGGDRALDYTRKAVEYLFGSAATQIGVAGEEIISEADKIRLHAPKPARGRVAFCGGNFPARWGGASGLGMAAARGGLREI